MEHGQPYSSINSRTCKKGKYTSMPGGTPNPPSKGSTVPKEQGSESHLRSLDTVKVILKLKLTLLLESTTATYDLHKTL